MNYLPTVNPSLQEVLRDKTSNISELSFPHSEDTDHFLKFIELVYNMPSQYARRNRLTVRRVQASDLKPGDWILICASENPTYWHHAIVVEVGEGPDIYKAIFIVESARKLKPSLKGEIRKVSLLNFVHNDKKRIFYCVDHTTTFPNRNVLPVAERIRIALKLCEHNNPLNHYHLTNHNCEHVATRCMFGEEISSQADTIQMPLFFAFLTTGVMSWIFKDAWIIPAVIGGSLLYQHFTILRDTVVVDDGTSCWSLDHPTNKQSPP